MRVAASEPKMAWPVASGEERTTQVRLFTPARLSKRAGLAERNSATLDSAAPISHLCVKCTVPRHAGARHCIMDPVVFSEVGGWEDVCGAAPLDAEQIVYASLLRKLQAGQGSPRLLHIQRRKALYGGLLPSDFATLSHTIILYEACNICVVTEIFDSDGISPHTTDCIHGVQQRNRNFYNHDLCQFMSTTDPGTPAASWDSWAYPCP